MRTITTKVYSAKHLKRYYPDGFNRALEKYRENLDLEYTSDEMMSTLKALCAAGNVKMRDWSLGAYNRGNNLSVSINGEDGTEELTGARALAWIENRILGPLRAPWGLRSVKSTNVKLSHGTHNPVYNVEDGKPRRRWTAPGAVPSCPLTGMCYDGDFLEDLQKSVKEGRTLKEAFEDLADLFASMLEDEYEYQGKEEQFLDAADANHWEYEKDGTMV